MKTFIVFGLFAAIIFGCTTSVKENQNQLTKKEIEEAIALFQDLEKTIEDLRK